MGNEEVGLLNACLDAKLEMMKDIEEGADNKVCRGIEEYAAMRKAEGKAEGEERLNTLMNVLAARGYQLTEILTMTSDAKKRAQLYEEYGIA